MEMRIIIVVSLHHIVMFSLDTSALGLVDEMPSARRCHRLSE
jgi:hypothetical protein